MQNLRPFFRSYFQAGFECSTHVNVKGQRLDLLASTAHDCFAERDLSLVKRFGFHTVRTAARWYKIEAASGRYDFSSLAGTLDAADRADTEVLLDILHFGWPEHIDVFSSSFPRNFSRFVSAAANYLKTRHRRPRFIAPINEISYTAWAAGEVGAIGPHARGRGHELKRNLVSAAVNASEILLNELPGTRLIAPEPVIHIVGNPGIPNDEEEAAAYTNARYESWDMLSGRMHPELGGRPEFIDVIGVNFYERNEWVHNSTPITRDHPRWRPFRHILEDVWHRYRRPMFVAETGTEDDRRAGWLHYIASEVRAAIQAGVPMHGICLYPIFNHAGWDDDRHCHNGLFDYANENGERQVYEPLAQAIHIEQDRFARFFRGIL